MFNFELETFRSFRDRPESAFYQADGMSPEQTWGEITDQLVILIRDLLELRQKGEIEISLHSIRGWHGAIFGTTFPDDAGRLRWKDERGSWEHVDYGVDVGTVRTAKVQVQGGTHPNRIERRLAEALTQFHQSVAAIRTSPAPTLEDAAWAASRLYAKVLSVHPFIDGNLRAAYAALQTALLNFDLPAIQFSGLEEHDEALGRALRVDGQQTYEPLATLITKIIKEAV